MCSFISDAEPCCKRILSNLQQLPWVGATRCPLLPREARMGLTCRALGTFDSATPDCRLARGKDRGSHGAGYVWSCLAITSELM
jgi:hypothetical protein